MDWPAEMPGDSDKESEALEEVYSDYCRLLANAEAKKVEEERA